MEKVHRFVIAIALTLVASGYADARVVRLIVDHAQPVAGGARFGNVGPYERLTGTVHFEVDPADPLDAVIVNLDKAPRNANGLVEFSAPFVIIKPVDIARGNQKILAIAGRSDGATRARGATCSSPFIAAPLASTSAVYIPPGKPILSASRTLEWAPSHPAM
jgi:hypothetical protein